MSGSMEKFLSEVILEVVGGSREAVSCLRTDTASEHCSARRRGWIKFATTCPYNAHLVDLNPEAGQKFGLWEIRRPSDISPKAVSANLTIADVPFKSHASINDARDDSRSLSPPLIAQITTKVLRHRIRWK